MIVAGLALLAVGLADLIRHLVRARRRWIVHVVVAILLFVASAGIDAAAAALFAIGVAAVWLLVSPLDGSARTGLWPVSVLALVCTASVAFIGPRTDTGPLGESWPLPTPFGSVSLDGAVLVLGVLVFLLESGNVLVRTALRSDPDSAEAAASNEAAASGRPALRGGRIIGPLERVLVFSLSLAGAYTLLAAVLAAKGIVRFPEISQDGDRGGRAEYFLVGSLVSWVAALAGAFLVWWALAA